jgi:hypothetical protein
MKGFLACVVLAVLGGCAHLERIPPNPNEAFAHEYVIENPGLCVPVEEIVELKDRDTATLHLQVLRLRMQHEFNPNKNITPSDTRAFAAGFLDACGL